MPSPPLSWQDLIQGKRARGEGDLNKLRRELWKWIRIASAGIDEALRLDDHDLTVKWLYCAGQLANSYGKLLMDSEIEERLKALEAKASTNGHSAGVGYLEARGE